MPPAHSQDGCAPGLHRLYDLGSAAVWKPPLLIDLEVLAAASTCVQVSVVDTRHRWVGRARNEWPSGEAQLRQL